MERILEMGRQLNATGFVTTEKDDVKLTASDVRTTGDVGAADGRGSGGGVCRRDCGGECVGDAAGSADRVKLSGARQS